MTDEPTATETMKAAAAAVTGPHTPEAVKVVEQVDRLTLAVRNGSGPVVTGLVVFCIWILTWGPWPLNTAQARIGWIGIAAIILCATLALVILTLNRARPGRIEVKAGPVSVVAEGSGED